MSTAISLQRSEPLQLEHERQVERSWALLGVGGGDGEGPIQHSSYHMRLLWSSTVCPALWAGVSAAVLLSSCSHLTAWPPFRLLQHPLWDRVLSCLLPLPQGCLMLGGEGSYHLPTGPGSAWEKLLMDTMLWNRSIPCTELPRTSLGMRPVWKNSGNSARKMRKHLQLDFSYTGKGDNSIFLYLFRPIPF